MDSIDWERLDFLPYIKSYPEAFRERFGKFPEEFYVALEHADVERKRVERTRLILKKGYLRVRGSFLISFR